MVDAALARAHGLEPAALAAICFDAGVEILQLRAKQETSASLLALADALVACARRYRARVIINDRADLAAMSRAAGVHVGQDDLPLSAARAIVGPEAVVGISTHTREQIDGALGGAGSYLAVGPVFETTTKQTGYEAVGLPLIRYAAHRGVPIVAIGGLTVERAPRVIEAGATAVAVIGDLLVAGDPAGRIRDYMRVLA